MYGCTLTFCFTLPLTVTTAARPTWEAAKGGNSIRDYGAATKQYSVKDIAQQTKLKFRQPGQDSNDDLLRKDFLSELEARESEHIHKRDREALEDGVAAADVLDMKRPRLLPISNMATGLDDDDDDEDEDAIGDRGGDESSDDSDDEDDTAALMLELEKIKQERAEESTRQEVEAAEEEERIRKDNILHNNPLLVRGAAKEFTVARRWDDDVVFKNQTRTEPEKDTRFINDVIRSDFHRSFMKKYLK